MDRKPGSAPPLGFRLACAWNRWAPRGKGWLPRHLGRMLYSKERFFIRTRSGANLAVCPNHFDIYCHIQTNGGTWDPEILDTCLRVIRPGDVFYDIGANAGLFSIEVANTFRGEVTVHAFEPQADLYACILATAAAAGLESKLHAHQVLLSDEDGQAELFLHAHAVHASMSPRTQSDAGLHSSLRLPTFRLDTLMSQIQPPDVIKIDVEGAELKVMQGAHQMLSARAPTIIIEADCNMQRFGYRHTDLFGLLMRYAEYTIFLIASDGRLTHLTNFESAPEGNYIMVPPDRIDVFRQDLHPTDARKK